jgi:hypothetical protein
MSPATEVWHDGLASGVRPWSQLRCEIWTSTSRRFRFGGVGAGPRVVRGFGRGRLHLEAFGPRAWDSLDGQKEGCPLGRPARSTAAPRALRRWRDGSDYACTRSTVSAEHRYCVLDDVGVRFGGSEHHRIRISSCAFAKFPSHSESESPFHRESVVNLTRSVGQLFREPVGKLHPRPVGQLFREPVGKLHPRSTRREPPEQVAQLHRGQTSSSFGSR